MISLSWLDAQLSRALRALWPSVPGHGTSQTEVFLEFSPGTQLKTTKERSMQHRFAPAGIDTGDAEKVGALLAERLASLIDLSLTLKHVHWNVIGPGFIAIHELMDKQADATREMADEIAERLTTLGGVADGLTQQVAKMREADERYALGRAPVMAHLGALDKVYEQVTAGHRETIEMVAGIDPITEDLLITQSARLELNHWFIRAHIENADGRLATEGTVSQMDAANAAVYALRADLPTEEIDLEEIELEK